MRLNSQLLGKNKWVTVREFKGQIIVDIREYYVDIKTMDTKPGKKGISLNVKQFKKLKVKVFLLIIKKNVIFLQAIVDDIDHVLP